MKRRLRTEHTAAGGLYTFALLGIFALLSMFLVVIGARVYRSVTDSTQQNYAVRAALSYVAGKVRSADQPGGVSLRAHEGVQVLSLSDPGEDGGYETRIFARGGALCEGYCEAGAPFDAENSETLVAGLEDFSLSAEGNLIHVRMRVSGEDYALSLALRSGEVIP